MKFAISRKSLGVRSITPSVDVPVEMFLQFALLVLAALRLQGALGNPIVVVSQHQLRNDIRKEVIAAVKQSTSNISDSIDEVATNTRLALHIVQPLKEQIMAQVNATLEESITTVITAVELLVKPLLDELDLHRFPGKTSIQPAASCEEVKGHDPTIPSGYYWIQTSSHPLIQVYCEMTKIELLIGKYPGYPAESCKKLAQQIPDIPSGYYWIKAADESSVRVYCETDLTCGGKDGGWMRVANVQMNDTSHTCPEGLVETEQQSQRLCTKGLFYLGCSSAAIDVYGVEYSRVCGRIIGYQFGSPDSFYRYYSQQVSIDSYYVDGVSLTHGTNPRKHIWTFAAATDEESNYYSGQCPCVNTRNTRSRRIPPWVGNDYFCDTGARWTARKRFYPDDPLWDGEGCEGNNVCCSFNQPPWFFKQLGTTTTDNIELRICTDDNQFEEGVYVEVIELYVQ